MEFVKDSVFNQTFEFESDLIDVKKYFGDYAQLLTPVERCNEDKCTNSKKVNESCGKEDCKNDEFYRNYLDITQEELKELKDRTSVELLTCEDEIEPVMHDFCRKLDDTSSQWIVNKPKETETPLISVNKRSEMVDLVKSDLSRVFYKYCNYKWCMNNDKQAKTELKFDLKDVVACIKVYCPFLSYKGKSIKIKLLQEIHILGNQTLADLKDKIICSLDFVGDKDISSEFFLKDVGVNITAKDEYPSSFIFIENTFYNDTRNSKMIDLSKDIIEWSSKTNVGPFNSASMENARICDINVKIGHPYVYQHQSNCEHIIIFSDLRFLDFSDSYRPTSYPRTHCIGRMYGKHCMMCTDSYARWLVVGNERLTHDKAYLCNKCFFSYNYIDGQKVGQFQAYKYVDPVGLL